jgi:hypothetical protein
MPLGREGSSVRKIIRPVWLLFLVVPLWGQRGYPRIETIFPGAVERGTTTEVSLTGRYNLRDAYRVLFADHGVSATVLGWSDLADPAVPDEKRKPFELEGLKLKITVSQDAEPGIRPFRILTKGSLSALANLYITDLPAVREVEPNDKVAEAQMLELPRTVNGLLDQEADEDVYRFQAEAGDSFSFCVYSARLQHPVPHLEKDFADVVMTLRDARGNELAAADDWTNQDPQMFYRFEAGGTYYLHLREARNHAGKGRWWYVLNIGKSPVITSVFPPVVAPGSKVKLDVRGFRTEEWDGTTVEVPASAEGQHLVELHSARGVVHRIPLLVSKLPHSVDASASSPIKLSVPHVISGRTELPGEVDRFRFRAKAGQRFEFEVKAPAFGSLLDPLIELRDISGELLEVQDDGVNVVGQTADGLSFPVDKDPRLEWTAPEDGEYELDVRDANYFGSKDHVYYLTAKLQEEDFALILDDDRLPVGPGESYTSVVTIERRNGFTGPVALHVSGLPEGIVAHESTIPAHLDQANIVLTATLDSKPDARDITVAGLAKIRLADGTQREVERIARPYAPMGQAGGRSFYAVRSATAAITEGSDIIMEASPKELVLRPGEAGTVNIRVRRNNYTGPVEVNVILWNLMQRFSKLPKGILFEEKLSRTSLGPGETEAKLTFRAQRDAPLLENYLMAPMGQITYNRIFMTRTAAPFRLSIKPLRD